MGPVGFGCILVDHAVAFYQSSIDSFEELRIFEEECERILKSR